VLRAEELTPADLFQVIWRQRFALVGFALAGAAIAYGYSLFIPDRYTAETLVLVEDAELPQKYVQSTSTLSLRARLDTLREQVLSRTRLEDLVSEYELVERGAPLESAVAKVRRRIGITVIGRDGFRLSFTDEDPRMAARVANALAGFFIAESAEALERQVFNTATGIELQTAEVRQQLDAKEHEIATFKSANVMMLPGQFNKNLNMLQSLRQELRDNVSRASVVRGELAALPIEPMTSAAVVQTTTARDAARQILSAARTDDAITSRLASEHPLVQVEARRLQRDSLLRRFTERHPDVRWLVAEIASLEGQVAGAGPYVPVVLGGGSSITQPSGAARAALETEAGQLEIERTRLLADQVAYQARVDGGPAVEQQLRELQRERDSLDSNYSDLTGRNLEADLASDLQTANAPFASYRVIDPAVVPNNPTSPLRMLFLFGGAIAGIALVGGAAFLREMVFEPVNTASEIERFTELDVLASIPVVQTAKRLRRQRLIRIGSVTAVGSVLVVVFVLRVMMRGL